MADLIDEKKGIPDENDDAVPRNTSIVAPDGKIVNASGHVDQLQRGYGLLSICGLALTVDNAWIALGTSLYLSVYNGGPPGILYELLVATIYYAFINASIAELGSAIPSAGGVYHWASVTPGPRWGRVIGFYAGFLNFFGWIFDVASICYIMSELVVQMYALFHDDLVIQAWQLYVAYLLIAWLCVGITIFGNRFLPALQSFGLFIIIVGGLVTIIVVAAMPKKHASTAFVFTDYSNQTGWSGGVAFLTGVLNGAFTIGTPDAVTHMAEELPNPKKDIPKAIAFQLSLGCLTAFLYGIAIFYGINDLSKVLTSNGSFPLAEVYLQATDSKAATFGLLFIIFLSLVPCLVATLLTVGRTWWAMARDRATPFSTFFARVNERLSCPVEATLWCGIMTSGFGAITLGSKTAFTDLAGSFIILTTISYACAIAPHAITGRRYVPRTEGAFWLGKFGYPINVTAVLLIVFFSTMFCFPYALPTSVPTMNYNSVILAGFVFLITVWWFVHGLRKYKGPKLSELYANIEGIEPMVEDEKLN